MSSRCKRKRNLPYSRLPLDTSLYMDLGDCTYICQYCGALFWYEERCHNTSTSRNVRYTQCCKGGTIKLPLSMTYNRTITSLFTRPEFLNNIRAYNSMFAMTSFGAKVDDSINDGSAPYVFRVEGQICHRIGSLCPPANEKPRFLQMYIYDTENETTNRLAVFNDDARSQLSPHIVSLISKELHNCNELVKLFQNARDLIRINEVPNFSIRLYSSYHALSYDKPTDGCIGAIISDIDPLSDGFDIVIRNKQSGLQRINKLHPLYMSLQYPLLFIYGESGWSPDMHVSEHDGSRSKKLTMNMYYSYQLHDRHNLYTLLLRGGRLFQQYLVDAYVCIEQDRLDYYRYNQSTFRSEYLHGIHDAILRGDTDGHNVGKRTILPSSFTGGPRYMYKHYQDALAICRVHGNPQYFITFTCNVKWPEIERYMAKYPPLKAQDRPEIIARVFKMKLYSLLNFIRTERPFGEVVADLYTVEFQKRGLPHCHMLVWIEPSQRIKDAKDIDNYINAEIPDPVDEAQLYKIVSNSMMHGLCGIAKPDSRCMKLDRCSKKFPKNYEETKCFDKNGYAQYKRRQTARFVVKNGVPLDNRFVVPYNRSLCLHFEAHINVEYCGWSMLVKYLFKYISKGPDHIRYAISRPSATSTNDRTDTTPVEVDEIKNFVDSRFICPHEAAWRILNFHIHDRNPPVQLLAVHLEDMQKVYFKDKDKLKNVARNPSVKTTLTEWLRNNQCDERGRHLTYINYISEYRWVLSSKYWSRRSSRKTAAIGRMIYVHPTCDNLFYLRMLLSHQKGCQTFKDIHTVDGQECVTYRDACDKLGLLQDDDEWSSAFNEAALWATAKELRTLFTHMLLYCEVSNPRKLWCTHWNKMADDIAHTHGIVNSEDLEQYVLYEIELILRSSTPTSSLSEFGLPLPNQHLLLSLRNKLLLEEKNYDRQTLATDHVLLKERLNDQQRQIYDFVNINLASGRQVLAFVYGHGGTGKTYLWTTIISGLRSDGKIVLAVAASGIASLLLPSGRTAHSRFKIPLDLNDESTCNVKKNTHLAELLIETSLIIWDEAPMNDRKCFESLDRTLKDLLNNDDQPFGGKSILLGGDFRQTLPVKKRASKHSIIASSLPKSYLWSKFKVFLLTENMRLQRPGLNADEIAQISNFSSWIITIGNGDIGKPDANDFQNTKVIQIPSDFLIPFHENALTELIQFIYDDDTLQNPTATNLCAKAIVCPKNETADDINSKVLDMTPGTTRTYLSTDTVVPHTGDHTDTEILYPTEYLNLLTFNGLPPHQLQLKPSTPIMLLRNLNQNEGLCNGTRLLVTQLLPRVIEAQVMTGTMIDHRVYIPRITLTYTDNDLPFLFKRKQFPIKLCYAMTINKSQGQSLNKIGVYLPQPVFSHGQLYVALSRATSPSALKILILPEDKSSPNETKNIVYSDFLTEINRSL